VEAIQDTVPMRLLPEHLIAIGEPVVALERISALVGLSPRSVHAGVSRLRRQGRLFSPARGLYVAVPPEYRSWGVVPAEWFIDPMMAHLGRTYYVGLLTAAAMHGAAHQAPQVFQVMIDRQLADRDLGRVRLRLHVNSLLEQEGLLPTVEIPTHTGTLVAASRELTAVDLVTSPDDAGGLDNVATVLVELGRLDVGQLASVCRRVPRAVTRRLGWLLAHVAAHSGLGDLQRLAAPDVGDPTPLDTHGERAGPRDIDWGIIVNASVEPDVW